MYKLKYYLWMICIVTCFVTNVYANGNDLCNPIDMNADPNYIGSCTNDTNIGATSEDTNGVLWYKFQTTTAGYYEIKMTNASFYYSLYLIEIDCSTYDISVVSFMDKSEPENEFDVVQENLIVDLAANTTYTFRVGESSVCTSCETQGTFCVQVNQIASNQECTDATEIELVPDACVTGSNYYASDANPQPSCNPHIGASVWYQISAPTSGMIQMETFPNFSEVITVYEGTCGNLDEILCSVNGDDNDGTLIINNLIPDDTYYIQVTGNFPTIEADNGLVCDDNNYITISTVHDCPTNPPLTDGGSPEPKPCNDNNPNTTDDVWRELNGNCQCVGNCANNPGDICDDGIPNDTTVEGVSAYDFWDENCNCQSECPRTPEDDCPNTKYIINIDCKCECDQAGEPCYGDDPNREYTWNDSCECVDEVAGGVDYCPTDIILDEINIDNNIYFQTSDYIETDGSVIVEVGEDLTLNAKNYIKLKPGFNAKVESTMRAYINGCEPTVQKAEELTTASVKHYPNPFRNQVTLEFQLDLDADVEIMITDVNGKIVSSLSIDNLYRGIQTHSISTQDWVPGIYFYQALIKEQNTGILSHANGTLVKM